MNALRVMPCTWVYQPIPNIFSYCEKLNDLHECIILFKLIKPKVYRIRAASKNVPHVRMLFKNGNNNDDCLQTKVKEFEFSFKNSDI